MTSIQVFRLEASALCLPVLHQMPLFTLKKKKKFTLFEDQKYIYLRHGAISSSQILTALLLTKACFRCLACWSMRNAAVRGMAEWGLKEVSEILTWDIPRGRFWIWRGEILPVKKEGCCQVVQVMWF